MKICELPTPHKTFCVFCVFCVCSEKRVAGVKRQARRG
jgi:hypothetical protein